MDRNWYPRGPRKPRLAGVALSVLLALVPTALAAGSARLTVHSDEDLGKYLADALGRGLYVFVTPTREDALGTLADRPTPPCDAACRTVWPPLLTDGAPDAVPAIPARRLGTVDVDGGTQVTFDGWPLYRFVRDRARGDINGEGIEPPAAQAFGGAWYLIAPDGSLVKPVEGAGSAGSGVTTGEGGNGGGDSGGGGDGGGGDNGGGGNGGEMKAKLEAAQAELASRTAEGEAGAGAVRVTMNGKFETVSVAIDPSMVGALAGSGTDADREMVEELLASAFNDAAQKVQGLMTESMGDIAGGLNLPGVG